MPWTTRRRNLAILIAIAAAAAGAFVLGQRGNSQGVARDLLMAAPRDAFLVAEIDVQALRASPLADAVLGSSGGHGGALPGMAGMNEITVACGFDPFAKVTRVVVAIPEGGEPGEFGVAARGAIEPQALIDCAKKAVSARGGRAKVSQSGAYAIIEDDEPSAKGPRVALRDASSGEAIVLVGKGAWLEAMMRAAEGLAPSVRANEQHMELRGPLASKAPVVLASAILPKTLRDRLKREMGGELEGAERAKLEMGGVLAVQSAALALSIGAGPDSETAAFVELRCESGAACNDVKELVERKRLDASKDIGVRLVGLGPVLDSLQVTVTGSSLDASAHAPTAELAKALDRVLKLRSKDRPRGAPPLPTPPAISSTASSRAPDEVVPARPAASAAPSPSPPSAASAGAPAFLRANDAGSR